MVAEEGFTLEDIVEREEVVLLDSSICNLRSFSREFKSRAFRFNPDYVASDCDMIEEVSAILEEDRYRLSKIVYTVEKVVEELKQTDAMVRSRLKEMNNRIKIAEKEKRKYHVIDKETYDLLSKLAWEINKLVRSLKKVCYESKIQGEEKRVYNLFNELIKLFGKYFKPLKLKKQRQKGIARRKRDQGSQTDELLIATAYHIAMFRKKRTAIITEDTDFLYLVGIGHRLLMAEDLDFEKRDCFRQILNEYPITIYSLADTGSSRRFLDRLKINEIVPAQEFRIYTIRTDNGNANVKMFVERILNSITKVLCSPIHLHL
ncbi:hypothetical protein DRZ77_00130 [Candidatus Woesearchaeota archaeon]|nr:hypothetical protein [Candidatus Woesearchaeota archaeon]RLE41140.1 MAG: hypothetical protein DRZ77_00130 [Candidatus Woesearchaeota archaeon]